MIVANPSTVVPTSSKTRTATKGVIARTATTAITAIVTISSIPSRVRWRPVLRPARDGREGEAAAHQRDQDDDQHDPADVVRDGRGAAHELPRGGDDATMTGNRDGERQGAKEQGEQVERTPPGLLPVAPGDRTLRRGDERDQRQQAEDGDDDPDPGLVQGLPGVVRLEMQLPDRLDRGADQVVAGHLVPDVRNPLAGVDRRTWSPSRRRRRWPPSGPRARAAARARGTSADDVVAASAPGPRAVSRNIRMPVGFRSRSRAIGIRNSSSLSQ